jgi:probable HAF family extracellular repeat protein
MRNPRLIGVTFLASVVLLICNSVIYAQFRFSVTPIGENLFRGRALAINDNGQVAGMYGQEETSQSFLWSSTTGLQLLPSPAGSQRAAAVDINNAGTVLGWDNGAQVWTWEGGAVHLIPSLAGSAVTAINSAGQIAGYGDDGNKYHPFRWQNGQKTPLLTTDLDNEGTTAGINEAGDIAGGVFGAAAVWRANGSFVSTVLNTYAYDISDQTNCVVGSTGHRAFIWNPPGFTQDMGTHPANIGTGYNAYHAALAVNTVCHAVGLAEVNQAEDDRAFFWTADEGMMDLNALLDASGEGWVLELALDINNSDQIVGFGHFNGEQRAFLLTPVQVPEPGAVVLGLVAAMFLPRRRLSTTPAPKATHAVDGSGTP